MDLVGKVISLLLNMLSAAAAKLLQSCLTLSKPRDCSLPDSSVHGIFQARVLEWGAIALDDNNWAHETEYLDCCFRLSG